ncbi:MAG: TIGR03118 family protein [Terriglobia bacterium]
MEPSRLNRPGYLIAAMMIACVFVFPQITRAQFYLQQNLVINATTTEPNLDTSTTTTDPNLVNPWGMVQSSGSPFWVSKQGTNTSTLYNGQGIPQPAGKPLIVNIPTVAGTPTGFPPNGPTGIVFNTSLASSSPGFNLPGAKGAVPSVFIFANLNGQISGWNPGSTAGPNTAIVEVDNSVTTPPPTTVYTGLAINATGSMLYAANFNAGGGIQAFTSDWKSDTSLTFTDPNLPKGYEPYNVQDINGTLFAAYAIPGMRAPGIGPGLGAVAEFNETTGAFIKELVGVKPANGLNAPWGMAMAPANWGKFGGDLLVGNFGSGWISAYDPSTRNFLGYLDSSMNTPITDVAMWALEFGTGGAGSHPNTLYITAGVDLAQDQGVMAAINPSPEPATALLFAGGLLALGFLFYRRHATEA